MILQNACEVNMRSDFKEAKISLTLIALILAVSIVFYFFVSMFTSMGYEGYRKAKDANTLTSTMADRIIIIDAGHGGEDPGAEANGLIEKDLNLEIALALDEMLRSCGYKTVLTRSDDRLLYNVGQENRKKHYDLRNRESIANEYENSVFVSIHMNKFPESYCKGLQTFYSENNELSKALAESVQANAKNLQTDNKRSIKCGNDTIYLLERLKTPAILIECGFLSNYQEATMLSDSNYKKALVLTLYCGITEFMEN